MEGDGPSTIRRLGRYTVHREFASGGMGTLFLGLAHGTGGFCRPVAIKTLRAFEEDDADLKLMMMDEARLVARILHQNVVPVLDVLSDAQGLYLVMEYVHGEPLSRLLSRSRALGVEVPQPVLVAVLADVLNGLHAAHEAVDRDGQLLSLVHRDVSPDNVLVGADGLSRITDFGVAKAKGRLQASTHGRLKGKIAYMAPEQLMGADTTRRADVYSAGVILWEGIAGRRLHDATDAGSLLHTVMAGSIPPPSAVTQRNEPMDGVIMRALGKNPQTRFPTAIAMVSEMVKAIAPATRIEVAAWVESLFGDDLSHREELVREMEIQAERLSVPPAAPTSTAATATPIGTARGSGSRNKAVVATLVVLLVALLGGAYALAFRTSREPQPIDVASTVLSTTSEQPAHRPPDATAPIEPAVSSSPVTSTTASPSTTRPAPPRPNRGAPPQSKPRPRRSPPRPQCVPPYILDAAGNRRYKLECL